MKLEGRSTVVGQNISLIDS